MDNWLDKSEYPFNKNYFEVNNHRLHYIDEGKGDIVLYVHGTPSWSFDFRHIIKGLKDYFRCVAIDHIGFGLSDKPENYDYSIQNHCQTLEKFISENQLADITLIVHDFGGPIGFNFAIQHPEKIKNIIILNSWMWSSKTDPDFIRLSKILKNPILPFLYLYLNFSPKFILPKSFGSNKIEKNILKQYTGPFPGKSTRYGTLAFAKSLLNDQDWFESLWEQKKAISDKPVMFIWGMKDMFIKPHYLEKFKKGFPNSTTIELETCGHFPQEEQPDIVLKEIKRWLIEK